ncbi:MAG: hypothetical protein V1790_17710 [Planctomycetota bacterium]
MKKISQALLSAYARILGSIGGKAGSRADKVRACQIGNAMLTPEERTARARKAGLASAKARRRA